MVLTVDGANSISTSNWPLVTEFLTKFTFYMLIDVNHTQMGIVQVRLSLLIDINHVISHRCYPSTYIQQCSLLQLTYDLTL